MNTQTQTCEYCDRNFKNLQKHFTSCRMKEKLDAQKKEYEKKLAISNEMLYSFLEGLIKDLAVFDLTPEKMKQYVDELLTEEVALYGGESEYDKLIYDLCIDPITKKEKFVCIRKTGHILYINEDMQWVLERNSNIGGLIAQTIRNARDKILKKMINGLS
jgi:hypothetical protein